MNLFTFIFRNRIRNLLSLFFLLLIFISPSFAEAAQVTFLAVDQHGYEVAEADIYVQGYGTVSSGGSFDIDEGQNISYRGKTSNISGNYLTETIDASTVQLTYPFQTILFNAIDQHGFEVTDATILISSLASYSSGINISLPQSSTIEYRVRKTYKIRGENITQVITNDINELTYPFKTILFNAKDQHGSEVADATIYISSLGSYSSGSNVSLPLGSSVTYRSKKTYSIGGEYITDVITNDINELTYPFQNIQFKVVDLENIIINDASIYLRSFGFINNAGYASLPLSSEITYNARYNNQSYAYQTSDVTGQINEIIIPLAIGNRAPISDAGMDISGLVGIVSTLNGSGSSDPDGDSLSYSWSISSSPINSSASLNNEILQNPSITPDIEGDYTFQLVVNDGEFSSVPDVVELQIATVDSDNDGVNNNLDQCPGTPAGEAVNASGCSATQLDDDNDGVNNSLDQCPSTPAGEAVNASGCSATQLDDDNDGVNNSLDQCPSTPAGEAVNANGCSATQLDDDNDGVNNSLDFCPSTPVGEAVNASGCSDTQLDDDNDGVNNSLDLCPTTPAGDSVNANGCSDTQLDDDNDGVNNNLDQCPSTPAGESVNASGCSDTQLDDDNDGVNNNLDLCPATPVGESVNASGCSDTQLDDDNDSINNSLDLCPSTPAGEAVNASGCSDTQLDDDNDGVNNSLDTCPGTSAGETVNTNGCSNIQLDNDNDGVNNNLDHCFATPTGETVNANGCSETQLDDDNDGVNNSLDLCPSTPIGESVNTSGCSDTQLDDDNDGVNNSLDQCPSTPAGESVNANGCSDTQLDDDNDGVNNSLDICPSTPVGEAVNASGCSETQLDDDNDGVNNVLDLCPSTPIGESVNTSGCSDTQLDDDNDGVNNSLDQCPSTPVGESVNESGCSSTQLDDDSDGVNNSLDLCPSTPIGESVNANGCSDTQLDDDSDGVNNSLDLCPSTPIGESVNANGCSDTQLDDDNDGVNNSLDICPSTPVGEAVNASGCSETQLDDDNDGVNNVLDICPSTPIGESVNTSGCSDTQLDDDNDGVNNSLDQCPSTPVGESVNAGGCSSTQLDDDSDGVINSLDQCPSTPVGESVNAGGCSSTQLDDDSDGVINSLDQCPSTPVGESVNASGCSATQLDDDNDGENNSLDLCPLTPTGEAVNASGCSETQLDDDNDGVDNSLDLCPSTPTGEAVNTSGCSETQLDDDNDGVNNSLDTCPASPVGESVNASGCSEIQLDDDNDGVNNSLDLCPSTSTGEAVNSGGCSDTQLDDDDDGVNNSLDLCSSTPMGESVNASGCSATQLDDDNDDVNNSLDQCPATPAGESVNVSGCSDTQLDDDNDGVNNSLDQCPSTPAGESANVNGCSETQLDDDNDGVNNSLDQCPSTPMGEAVNLSGCSATQLDGDSDGVNNSLDQCPSTPVGESVNASGCSTTQLDDDNDGVLNSLDQCPGTPFPYNYEVDINGCSELQLDEDEDYVLNDDDQCPGTPINEDANVNGCSPSQLDDDSDGVNNRNDQCPATLANEDVNYHGCSFTQRDDDWDGVSNGQDQCPETTWGVSVNTDGCSSVQIDEDSDGVNNDLDQCPATPTNEVVDESGCSTSQHDDDNDGVNNGSDQCSATPAGESVNASGCSSYQLADDDNDGVNNSLDQCPGTVSVWPVNEDGCVYSLFDDDDNDGVLNVMDSCPATPVGETIIIDGCSATQLDDDNDEVNNSLDICPSTPIGESVNASGCAETQLDEDNDGVIDSLDQCPSTPAGESVNASGCSETQLDDDNDGVNNSLDQCPSTPLDESANENGCAETQLDADSDGVIDIQDQCPSTPVDEAVNASGCADSQLDYDSDGVSNNLDQCSGTPVDESINSVGCANSQLDSDGDGVTDDIDGCLNDSNKTIPGICGCGKAETDGDDDGTLDCFDTDYNLPADPSTLAPEIDPKVVTSMLMETEFLYTGANPIQTGVASDTIEAERVAILRGRILDRDDAPLSGINISINKKPEFGQTKSRVDGMFDMVVNGGGLLTVNYEKNGYLPVQRQINVSWNDYAVFEDVVMIALDSQVTTIDLNDTSQPFQVAQGNPVTDIEGTRQATVFFPQGTSAIMTLPGGATQPLTTLNVRATEYTVGDNGPLAMPGDLPPTSAYTYAVELSVDEAIAAGALSVHFDQPVPVYVDNFLDFPVGEPVPSGWYDREKAAWVPSDNGLIIGILSITDDMADIDIDGSGNAASTSAMSSIGITDAERARLASLYTVDKSLWRIPVTHFTPWDFNWPYGLPLDAILPPFWLELADAPPDDKQCKIKGCIIQPLSQSLGEKLPVTGAPLNLYYKSDNMPGNRSSSFIMIPISNDRIIPDSLLGIDLTIEVAGQKFKRFFPAQMHQTYTFIWDGTDAYGRPMQKADAKITVDYFYRLVYHGSNRSFRRSFRRVTSGGAMTMIGSRAPSSPVKIRREWTRSLKGIAIDSTLAHSAIGGWGLDRHHTYNPKTLTLHRGDGSKREATRISRVITSVAGNGISGPVVDEVQATESRLMQPYDIVFAADGSYYIADRSAQRIRHVDPDGIITTVAGTGVGGYSGDGGPANEAQLREPSSIALGPDGSLYIADTLNHCIRHVDLDGIITTVAGTGSPNYDGDNGPADQAFLNHPHGIAVALDGSLYIADYSNNRIRYVGTDGIISTVAGTGNPFSDDDGILAQESNVRYPNDVAIGSDGSLYIAGNERIHRIGLDGIINTVAGPGVSDISGDGGPADEAHLGSPVGIEFGPDGSLYIADNRNINVRRIDPEGIISTIAGSGELRYGDYPGDGANADQFQFKSIRSVAPAPDGSVYIADGNYDRIFKVSALNDFPGIGSSEYLIPSTDGSRLFHFDINGRHLRTLNTVTTEEIYQFRYYGDGHLWEIEDLDGDITRIERSGAIPTAIVAQDGQRTELSLDTNGYLDRVTDPNNEFWQLGYDQGGLLDSFTDRNNNLSNYDYDYLGRLERDENPAGGGWELGHIELTNGYGITMTSAENRISSFLVERFANGSRRQTTVGSDNTVSTTTYNDNVTTTNSPDGTVSTVTEGPDPRFGMRSPIPETSTVTTPNGLTSTITVDSDAVLADPADMLSHTLLTDSVTVNGKTLTSSYDVATRTSTVTTAESRVVTTISDSSGRPASVEVTGLETQEFEYDSRGRLSIMAQGTGERRRIVQMGYDSNGYLETVTDPLDRVTTYQKDILGRTTRQILPDTREIGYSYDANGNLTSITPPGKSAHVFRYTSVNQTEDYDPPTLATGSTITTYSYNLDKDLELITRPDNQTIDYEYDTGGRLRDITIPRGQVVFDYYLTSGNLYTITAPDDGVLTYTYDGSLPLSEAWAGTVSGDVSVVYNNDFQVTSQFVNGANSIIYDYDDDGLLTQAGALTIIPDPDNGLLADTTLSNMAESYGYNEFGEVDSYSAAYSGTDRFAATYTRDKLGRITDKTETIGGTTHTYEYDYDLTGRLTDVTIDGELTSHYDYDSNGNRLGLTRSGVTKAGGFDEQDRQASYDNSIFTYTTNGELETKTTGPDLTTYNYDILGNLISVSLPDATAIEYIIDGRNRRVGKRVNGTLVQAFLYSGQLNPVAELDNSGNIVSRFVYATKGNVPDYMIKGGATYEIISDHLGSPRLVIDVDSGTIAQQINYDEFGIITLNTNPGFQPFGFAGGIYDEHTKLTRFGARDYDAETGRWTAKDPIGFAGGDSNLFGYVTQDPVNFIDPTGTIFVPGAIAGGVIGGLGSFAGTLVQGGSLKNALVNGLIGTVGGAIAGGLPGLGGYIGSSIIGGASNLLGQTLTKSSCDDYNWSSAISSSLGGAFTTKVSSLFTRGMPLAPRWVSAAAGSSVAQGPSTLIQFTGTAMGNRTGF